MGSFLLTNAVEAHSDSFNSRRQHSLSSVTSVTINDRLTSKVWIRKLSGKDAAPLVLKTIEALQPIKDLIHTITADNGKEFAKHQEIVKELQISFYFCKPYHSWERGAMGAWMTQLEIHS